MGRGLRYRIIILCVALLLGGCGELTPPAERKERTVTYTVRTGDTLYSIAWGYGLDYRELASWNNVPFPYLIHPGQQLSVTPPLTRRSPSLASRSAGDHHAKSIPPSPKAVPKTSSTRNRLTKPYRSNATKKVGDGKKMPTSSLSGVENPVSGTKTTTITTVWHWPAKGKVVAKFDADSGKKGIDITGQSGQPIFSAAAGDVVYSGNGLLGYGNLVIIKHDDVFLSAYGHNSQLLVKEGDKVAIGQEIAKMGISPKEGAMLHFEIRKEGKPVDPSKYLPKQN